MKKILLLTSLAIACTFNTLSAQEIVPEATQETAPTTEEPENGIIEENGKLDYRRSSIYSVLLSHPNLKFGSTIDSVFLLIPTSDKFNNHDVGVKSFASTAKKSSRGGKKKEAANAHDIETFIQKHKVPTALVAKWFNRDATNGAFNMDLVHERGFYDASQEAINKAKNDLYGKEFLANAGTDLIGKTFVLINDITFIDTGAKTAKVAGWMKLAGAIAGSVTGDAAVSDLANTSADLVNQIDGFSVDITSYLYCLDWTDKTLDNFYDNMWYDAESICNIKKQAFDATSLFTLRYIGTTTTKAANLSMKSLAQRSKEEQLTKVCTRALDKSVVELQREYDEFKVNVPIEKVNADGTVEVPIGLKEGMNKKSIYEVLMQVEDANKNISYERIGRIKPIHDKIWDNRFGAMEDYEAQKDSEKKEEDPEGKEGNPTLLTSTFEIISGKNKITEGLLIREVTIKRQ